MEKWVVLNTLLFLLRPSGKTARDEDGFLSNLLLEEPVDEAQCDRMQLDVAAMDSSMTLDSFPRLHGKWLSQESTAFADYAPDIFAFSAAVNIFLGMDVNAPNAPVSRSLWEPHSGLKPKFESKPGDEKCEVRPGPEFLLRSYSFTKNNSFRLLQHYYEDESCILPFYTIVARGELTLKEPSWVTPSGTECEYTLAQVTVIPHTTEASEKLSNDVKYKCSDRINTSWKPHREYIIYNLKNYEKQRKRGKYQRKKLQRDIDCLSALAVEFNELMLIRTQWRTTEGGKKNKELLLGDIHSQTEARFMHKPTAFQIPLLKSSQTHDCVNCQLISKGTERAPPHLLSKPQLPPLPHGQWVSQRCEVRPFGMFLTRKLSFDTRDHTWIGEYRFHADPFCTESAFVISASGSYLLGPIQNKEKMIRKKKTGTNFDFKIEDASLILYDPILKDTFNTETNCGVGLWQVGIPKELAPTSGCSILGIVLPSTEYELIKLEIDNKGTPLLFMGLPDTENKKRSHKERPTSYQAPLAQCSAFPQQTIHDNHLAPIYYARTAARSSAPKNPVCFCGLLLPMSRLFAILYFTSSRRKI